MSHQHKSLWKQPNPFRSLPLQTQKHAYFCSSRSQVPNPITRLWRFRGPSVLRCYFYLLLLLLFPVSSPSSPQMDFAKLFPPRVADDDGPGPGRLRAAAGETWTWERDSEKNNKFNSLHNNTSPTLAVARVRGRENDSSSPQRRRAVLVPAVVEGIVVEHVVCGCVLQFFDAGHRSRFSFVRLESG